MRSWTIRRKSRSAAGLALLCAMLALPAPLPAALQTDPAALYATMKAAFDRGARNGWHLADEVAYFSTVLDAGRAYELVRRDDPDTGVLAGYTVDLATRLHYDPLINRDAALWYVRTAAQRMTADSLAGARAQSLLAKLDAEDGDAVGLAHDAVADATANARAYPGDAEALVEVADAQMRAYLITKDAAFRSQALLAAAQPVFPIGLIADDTGDPLWSAARDARAGATGYTDTDRAAAAAMFSHRTSAHAVPTIGRVISHDVFLSITAPADEYFGRTKLSPIGVRNELVRIGKYLDAGWGDRMTQDTLWVIDSLDDWQHQYPRDYELPRLLLQTYRTLGRLTSPEALAARRRVMRELTVDYNATPEARTLLAAS